MPSTLDLVTLTSTDDGPNRVILTETGEDITPQVAGLTFIYNRGHFVGTRILTVEEYEKLPGDPFGINRDVKR